MFWMDFGSAFCAYQLNLRWDNFISIFPDLSCKHPVEFQEKEPASTCKSPFVLGLLEFHTVMLTHNQSLATHLNILVESTG